MWSTFIYLKVNNRGNIEVDAIFADDAAILATHEDPAIAQ
jgi:hypothetical protein